MQLNTLLQKEHLRIKNTIRLGREKVLYLLFF